MRRLTRGRADTDDEATPQASAASEPVSATPDAQQGGSGLPANGVVTPAGGEPETAVLVEPGDATAPEEATAPDGAAATGATTGVARDLPAGVDPGELAAVPSSASRGRLRKRLRYLRAVREILLRDIGGFYYEAQRAETGIDPHRPLLDAKSGRLARLDEEVRELESRLDEAHPKTILREPGLGGTCPQCGELHASDARFCARCGTALTGRARVAAPAAPAGHDASGDDGGKATTASLWGRPKRPEPAAPEPAAETAPVPDAPAPDEPAPTGSERS